MGSFLITMARGVLINFHSQRAVYPPTTYTIHLSWNLSSRCTYRMMEVVDRASRTGERIWHEGYVLNIESTNGLKLLAAV